MTEPEGESRYRSADYRVRLLLSVDLSGSTDFKSSSDGEQREHANPKWVRAFEAFYRDFPDILQT